jgi:flagellar motor protein MotB
MVERQKYEQALRDREVARNLLRRAMAQLEKEIGDREKARRELLSSVEAALKQRGVQVFLDQRSGILRLSGDLLFETGKSELSPDAGRTVQIVAQVLAETLPCYTAAASAHDCANAQPVIETVLVEGHTDRQGFANQDAAASQQQNDRLSADRALRVFIELLKARPDIDDLRNSDSLPLLGVSGYGQRRPLPEAQCDGPDDCPENRRIDLRFMLTGRSSDELVRMRQEIQDALGESK